MYQSEGVLRQYPRISPGQPLRQTDFGKALVKAGRLYQFADAASCRIVIEYIQQSSGIETDGLLVLLGVASAAIYDCLKRLLAGRKSAQGDDEQEAAQIELHTRRSEDGSLAQVLQIRTSDEAVVKRALDGIADAMANSNDRLEWNDNDAVWEDPAR